MAESSSSPDWDRPSRSRSQSQGRWMKKDRAEPPDSWEDDDDGRWQWWHKDDWYQNQDWDHKEDQGPSQGWKDWDEEDDGGSWQRYDERWKENPEKGRSLKKGQQEPWKRAGRMSGGAVAKQKLQKIQERDGIPSDPEEKKTQRLGAMSQSRYNRLMKGSRNKKTKRPSGSRPGKRYGSKLLPGWPSASNKGKCTSPTGSWHQWQQPVAADLEDCYFLFYL